MRLYKRGNAWWVEYRLNGHRSRYSLRTQDKAVATVKYAEVFWLRKRPLRDALEKPWQLPEAIARNIREGSANPRRQPRLSDATVARLARLTI